MKTIKIKKAFYMLIVPVVLYMISVSQLTVEAASWGSDSKGYYYYYDDEGHYYKDQVAKIGNYYYYFDENGYMITGWHKTDYGDWYYANKQGILITGWVETDGKYFYVEDGRMLRNAWVDGERYYVNIWGEMVSNYVAPYYYEGGGVAYYYLGSDGKVDSRQGWKRVNPSGTKSGAWKWTYVDNKGKVADGWLKLDNKWYYFDCGIMCTGKICIDEKYYVFDKSGAMLENTWYNLDTNGNKYGDWVYAGSTGELQKGWLKLGSNWYYFNVFGDMQTGRFTVYNPSDESTKEYVAKETGELVYGWYHHKRTDNQGRVLYDSWTYTNPSSGEVYTGWVKKDGEWRYIYKGTMIINDTFICLDRDENWNYVGEPKYEDYETYQEYCEAKESFIRANTYVFDNYGRLVHGWYTYKTSSYERCYYGDSAGRAYNGWVKSGGKYYYIKNGCMLRNSYTPDGYYVDYNGVCK